MISTCTVCNLFYDLESDFDKVAHDEHHRRWNRGIRALGYKPMPYAEREALKRQAGELLREGMSATEQAEGATFILRAWYDRDLEQAIQKGKVNTYPSFDKYILENLPSLNCSPEVAEQVKIMHV
ncbi:hypothetical protein K1X76_01400 [bacterium]|nr:hypothetical protein [bacterium]